MATTETVPDPTIRDRVLKKVVKVLGIDEALVTDDSEFKKDLNADSLDLAELVMEFEDEFKIDIPDADAEKITTFGDAVKRITERYNEKKAA